MYDYNINKILIGNQGEAQKWLPFSKSKLDNLRKQVVNRELLTQIIKNDSQAFIKITTNGDDINKIFINGASATCPNYLSGLIHESYISNVNNQPTLIEYYPSPKANTRGWQPNTTLAVKLADYYGISSGNNSQHTFIKSSMFSGYIRLLVQELLGTSNQIQLDYKWLRSHGLAFWNIVENNVSQQKVIEYPTYFLFQIDATGLYVKKVDCCKRQTDINYPYPTNAGYPLLPQIVPQFKNFSDNLYQEIANGTVIKLLGASDLANFYNKEPLFDNQGWLFEYHTVNLETFYGKQYLNSGPSTFKISNTCIDTVNHQSQKWDITVNFTQNTIDNTVDATSATISTNTYNIYHKNSSSNIYVPDYTNNQQYSPNNIVNNIQPSSNYNAPLYTISTNANGIIGDPLSVINLPIMDGSSIMSWPPLGDSNFNLMLDKSFDQYKIVGNESVSGAWSYFRSPPDSNGHYVYTLSTLEVSTIIPEYEREAYILNYIFRQRRLDWNSSTSSYQMSETADPIKGFTYNQKRNSNYHQSVDLGLFSNTYFTNIPKTSHSISIRNINDSFDKPYYQTGIGYYNSYNYLDVNGNILNQRFDNYLVSFPINNLSFIGQPN